MITISTATAVINHRHCKGLSLFWLRVRDNQSHQLRVHFHRWMAIPLNKSFHCLHSTPLPPTSSPDLPTEHRNSLPGTCTWDSCKALPRLWNFCSKHILRTSELAKSRPPLPLYFVNFSKRWLSTSLWFWTNDMSTSSYEQSDIINNKECL